MLVIVTPHDRFQMGCGGRIEFPQRCVARDEAVGRHKPEHEDERAGDFPKMAVAGMAHERKHFSKLQGFKIFDQFTLFLV